MFSSFKYGIFLFFLSLFLSAASEKCEPIPLDRERIAEVQKIVAKTMEDAGFSINGPNCYIASSTMSAALEVLGYRPITDYQSITSELHAFNYFPQQNIVSDITIGQFELLSSKTDDAPFGFMGTPQELMETSLIRRTGDTFFIDTWSFNLDGDLLPLSTKYSGEDDRLNMESVVQHFTNEMFRDLNSPHYLGIRKVLQQAMAKNFGCTEENWKKAQENHKEFKSHRAEKNFQNLIDNLNTESTHLASEDMTIQGWTENKEFKTNSNASSSSTEQVNQE